MSGVWCIYCQATWNEITERSFQSFKLEKNGLKREKDVPALVVSNPPPPQLGNYYCNNGDIVGIFVFM
jgi:hypothetical protein